MNWSLRAWLKHSIKRNSLLTGPIRTRKENVFTPTTLSKIIELATTRGALKATFSLRLILINRFSKILRTNISSMETRSQTRLVAYIHEYLIANLAIITKSGICGNQIAMINYLINLIQSKSFFKRRKFITSKGFHLRLSIILLSFLKSFTTKVLFLFASVALTIEAR